MAFRIMNKIIQKLETPREDIETPHEGCETPHGDARTSREDIETVHRDIETPREERETRHEDIEIPMHTLETPHQSKKTTDKSTNQLHPGLPKFLLPQAGLLHFILLPGAGHLERAKNDPTATTGVMYDPACCGMLPCVSRTLLGKPYYQNETALLLQEKGREWIS